MHRISFLMLIMVFVAGCRSSEPAAEPELRERPVPSVPPAVPQAQDARPIILAFGDSLTEGYRLPPGSGYPEQLQESLNQLGFQYRVVNAGLSGDTTSGGLGRLAGALQLKPAIVIIEL